MRFVWLNHWYPEAWSAWQRQGGPPLHGTADYWDVALRASGHESNTIVLNEHPTLFYSIANNLTVDVVCSLEVGRFPAATIRERIPGAKVVAFCSHRADDSALQGFDVVFSSFRWMPDYCRSIGVRCEYLPLAFGKPVLDRVHYSGPRDIPVAFIGGLGMRTWKSGTETMAKIAEAVPSFEWRGYWQGSESDIPPALQRARKPEVYGADMYRVLMQTKIALNRHGEIARGFGNNCRTYEAPGVGCWHLTDAAGEWLGATYDSPEEAVELIGYMLERDQQREREAKERQEFILKYHAFESRVPEFIRVIESLQ